MREIKFRGKAINRKDTWFIGDLRIDFETNEFWIFPKFEHPGIDKHRVDPETIGQFTGLKDKNGKEIYEGDTLNMFQGFGCEWKPRIVTVNYRPASFWVDFDFGCQSFILDDHDCSFEIIGNIHQNPELLEV